MEKTKKENPQHQYSPVTTFDPEPEVKAVGVPDDPACCVTMETTADWPCWPDAARFIPPLNENTENFVLPKLTNNIVTSQRIYTSLMLTL